VRTGWLAFRHGARETTGLQRTCPNVIWDLSSRLPRLGSEALPTDFGVRGEGQPKILKFLAAAAVRFPLVCVSLWQPDVRQHARRKLTGHGVEVGGVIVEGGN